MEEIRLRKNAAGGYTVSVDGDQKDFESWQELLKYLNEIGA